MTACCKRPICLHCFRQSRYNHDGTLYQFLGSAGHRTMSGHYAFRCPYCGHADDVKDYDPDSDALRSATMDGYKQPVLVVRIDAPQTPAGWV
jgi:hypothetical protein